MLSPESMTAPGLVTDGRAVHTSSQQPDPKYCLFVRSTRLDENSFELIPKGAGDVTLRWVNESIYDLAFDQRYSLISKAIIVGRGKDNEAEVFDAEDQQAVQMMLPGGWHILHHDSTADVNNEKMSSQSSIGEKLTVAFRLTIETQAPRWLDYAIVCGSDKSNVLLIVLVNKNFLFAEPLSLQVLLLNGEECPIIGYIVDNEPIFTAPDPTIARYLREKGGMAYVEFRTCDLPTLNREVGLEKAKKEATQRKRRAQKEKKAATAGQEDGGRTVIETAVEDIRRDLQMQVSTDS